MADIQSARTWVQALCCGAALSALSAGAAAAQDAASGQDGATALPEVVVTGTLLRGVAPAGTEVIGVQQKDIQATGATTSVELLNSVPQVSSFNSKPEIATITTTQIQVNRINLRNLPGSPTGTSTLLLVDGHRIASAGVTQFAPDADVIPPSIVERVEVVPDGGSSIYGTDAVGGVINFITRKRIDGVHVDVRGGLADKFNTLTTDLSAGKAWDSGSAYLAWDFAKQSTLWNRDRDYVKHIDWTTGLPVGRQCTPPNITANGVNYALPGLQPGSISACDLGAAGGTLFPRVTRNSIFGGVHQDLSSRVQLDVRAFFTRRDTWSTEGALPASANIGPSNPFYLDIPGAPGAVQNVQFDFGPVGVGQIGQSRIKEWGVTPTVTADLGHDWELRSLLNVGGSQSTFQQQYVNSTLLSQYSAGVTPLTALNPYDIAATPNRQLIGNVADFFLAGQSYVDMLNARVVADGPLFKLPGGDVRLAVGAEFLRNKLSTRSAGAGLSAAAFAATPYSKYTQSVKSVFGELQVPIVGPGNEMPGVHALNVSASARFDSYNDFGDTTNPKVGVTYEPVDWITLRGSWGKSFNAPTPVDQLGSLANTLLVTPAFLVPPPIAIPPGSVLVAVQGSSQDLQPQTATEYSVGADVRWPFVQGLRSSVSYYNIDYRGLLSKPPVFDPAVFFTNFPGNFVLNPTAAQIAAFANLAKGGAAVVAPYLAPGSPPVLELIDYRTSNFGTAKARGIDFSTQYRRDTGFGGVDLTINGNYQLKNEQTLGPGLPTTDNLLGATAFRLSVTTGADIGQLRAQVTLNHNASYHVQYSSALPQDSVGAYDVVSLFFRYQFMGEDWRRNLSVTMNVDNLFDKDPPVYTAVNGSGYANGSTYGRLVQFGVHKDF